MLKLLKLSPSEVVLLMSACWWLIWARNELRGLRGEAWLIGDKERRSAENTHLRRANDDEVKNMVKAIDRAARFPFRWSNCLQNSLALRRWLATRGVMAELQIGVKKEASGIAAHAWLECRNEVLNDTPEATSQYVVLTRGIQENGTTEISGLAWE